MSEPDLEKVRERHYRVEDVCGNEYCQCGASLANCDAIQLADEVERLREAGLKINEGFDQGVFIRSTKGDGDPSWAIKLLPYLRALAALNPEPEEK